YLARAVVVVTVQLIQALPIGAPVAAGAVVVVAGRRRHPGVGVIGRIHSSIDAVGRRDRPARTTDDISGLRGDRAAAALIERVRRIGIVVKRAGGEGQSAAAGVLQRAAGRLIK